MALAERTAEVVWDGTLADGDGHARGGSNAFAELPLDWASRSERADGKSSPEELLAAAHASCLAMTLSLLLARDGHRAERLDVRAKCSLDRDGKWYAVTAMDLEVRGRVPGLDAAAFEASAREADGGCAISNALRGGVELRLSATLED